MYVDEDSYFSPTQYVKEAFAHLRYEVKSQVIDPIIVSIIFLMDGAFILVRYNVCMVHFPFSGNRCDVSKPYIFLQNFSVLAVLFHFTNIADHEKMTRFVDFYLGLHCFSTYLFNLFKPNGISRSY